MESIVDIGSHALMITGFVFVMMLVIEYLNVCTQGNWEQVVGRWTWGQSAFCAFLGVLPGCLGAFAVSSLYSHRVVTLGALVAAMIATCGDEAFLMLALFPGRALLIFACLFVLGVAVGTVIDLLLKARKTRPTTDLVANRPTHAEEVECIHFSRASVWTQWRRCSPQRGWLTVFLVVFVLGVVSGRLGHARLGVSAQDDDQLHVDEHVESVAVAEAEAEAGAHGHAAGWSWVRVTLLIVGLIGLLIVVTVPDHFLDEHLWNHLVRVHIWRIFLWTLGSLLVVHLLVDRIDLEAAIHMHRLPILLLACLIGLIPESGPHMVFVTLYAQGAIPFSILLASCIVQDGHGMIPLLAHSRRAFVAVKAVNLAVGLAVGLLV